MLSDEDIKTGVAGLFAALAMAMDDEEHKLTARFRSKLAQLHHSWLDRDEPPRDAMEMLTLADDILYVYAKSD